MERCGLINIFLRSLLIQSSFNFRRMQNLGFAFSMIPLIGSLANGRREVSQLLVRHLQAFNTHPYFSGPVIGSVVTMEETAIADQSGSADDAADLKRSLMGPYAALGDSFFWGSLRPFSAIVGVTLAVGGSLAAPGAFLLLYNPSHIWVRWRGFIEGYRRGRLGVEFIKALDLLVVARRIRWASLVVLAILAAVTSQQICRASAAPDMLMMLALLAFVLLCFLAIRRGVSEIKLLYGMAFLFVVVSFI